MKSREIVLRVWSDRTLSLEIAEDGSTLSGKVELDSMHKRLLVYFCEQAKNKRLVDQRDFEVFGSLLYETLFRGEIRERLESEVHSAAGSRRLRILLSFEGERRWLSTLPWEFLHRPDDETGAGWFLAVDERTALRRYMPLFLSARDALMPSERPLRLLLIVCKPPTLGPVLEESSVEAARDLDQGQIEVGSRVVSTIVDLREQMRSFQPHVVHYIGHGLFDPIAGKGALAFMDNPENPWVQAEILAEVFHGPRGTPELFVLQACQGGEVDSNDAFAGVAPALMGNGAQAVVAMQYPITIEAAAVFIASFYGELAGGAPIDDAVQAARLALMNATRDTGDFRAFGTPVLYMRCRDGALVGSPG